MKEIPNFIEVYKKIFSDDFCNRAIEIFKIAEQAGMTNNRQIHDRTSKLQKEDNFIFLPSFDMNHLSDNAFMNEFGNIFWENCVKDYCFKYSSLEQIKQLNYYIMKIQKTEPGQGYHIWHIETNSRKDINRVLVWTVYLNDDFEAGETEFLYQQYRYKPSKGDVVIFPATFTHLHRGNPPIGGTKYIITGWIEA